MFYSLLCIIFKHDLISESPSYLHQFLQLPLDILQTADVLPGDVGHLHNRLSQGGWVALAQGPLQNNSV